MLARHIAQETGALIDRLADCGARPVDLLTEMQFLALEIAGRSMFSLAMDRHGAELRELVTGYAEHLGRPTLLDFLLPLPIPSPRDFARRRLSSPLDGADQAADRRTPREGIPMRTG